MKKLTLLIMIAVLFMSCTKNEIQPTNTEKDFKEPAKEMTTIYLVTLEFDNIANFQDFATNETEIKTICESLLSEYKEIQFDFIDYDLNIISYKVFTDDNWNAVVLKLWTFEKV